MSTASPAGRAIDVPDLAAGLRSWLVSGAAQSPGGAFYAWLAEEDRAPSFEYPEITGYALTHLAGQLEPTPAEVEAGRRAGQWLLQRFAAEDASAHVGYDAEAVYTFDLAMISTGLLAFGTRFGLPKLRERGLRLAAAMCAEIEQTGRLESIAPSSPVPTSRSAWSTEGYAHLLKAVQCLLWAETLGASGHARAARTLVDHCVLSQQPDGRFITHPRDAETMLHPHLYAVEGLWMLGTALEDDTALRRARLGTEWVWSQQLPSGGFPRYVTTGPAEPAPEQMDLTAQAVRAAIMVDLRPQGLAAGVQRLGEVAVRDGGSLVLPYQPGAAVRHLNVWVTLFGAQAALVGLPDAPAVDWKALV